MISPLLAAHKLAQLGLRNGIPLSRERLTHMLAAAEGWSVVLLNTPLLDSRLPFCWQDGRLCLPVLDIALDDKPGLQPHQVLAWTVRGLQDNTTVEHGRVLEFVFERLCMATHAEMAALVAPAFCLALPVSNDPVEIPWAHVHAVATQHASGFGEIKVDAC